MGKSPGTIRRKYATLNPLEHGRGLLHCQLALGGLGVGSRLVCLEGRTQRRTDGQPAFNKLQFTVLVNECPPPPASELVSPRILAGRGPLLLVDDDLEVRAGLAWKLLSWGIHPLTTVACGEDAVLAARAATDFGKPYELILMDIRLGGGIDGYEAARRIRDLGLPTGRGRRILSISVSDDDPQKRSCDRDRRAGPENPSPSPDRPGPPLATRTVDQPAASAGYWDSSVDRRIRPAGISCPGQVTGRVGAGGRRHPPGLVPERVANDLAHDWKTAWDKSALGLVAAVDAAQSSEEPADALEKLVEQAIRLMYHAAGN